MIKHIVTLDLAADHSAAELQAVMAGLDGLQGDLDGFAGFHHGPNRDFETMSPDCAYGFICCFADEKTARAYLHHPVHKALATRLVALCKGGVRGITVVDLELRK